MKIFFASFLFVLMAYSGLVNAAPSAYEISLISDEVTLSTAAIDDGTPVFFGQTSVHSFVGGCTSSPHEAPKASLDALETGSSGLVTLERHATQVHISLSFSIRHQIETSHIDTTCGPLAFNRVSARTVEQTLTFPVEGGAFDFDLDGKTVRLVVAKS